MAAQVAEYQSSTTGLWTQLFYQSFKLGPLAQAYMAWRAAPYMFSGIVASGAAQTIAATDYSRAATTTVAQMTATMVKLGFVELVASITSQCVRQDRPDAVAKISTEMMLAGEMLAITDITNKMVARGDISDAYYICRAMADHGHQEFLQMIANENLPEPVKVVKEHVDGAIAWVTGSGDKEGNKDGAEKVEAQAAKQEAEEKEQKEEGEGDQQKDNELETQSAPANLTAAS